MYDEFFGHPRRRLERKQSNQLRHDDQLLSGRFPLFPRATIHVHAKGVYVLRQRNVNSFFCTIVGTPLVRTRVRTRAQ